MNKEIDPDNLSDTEIIIIKLELIFDKIQIIENKILNIENKLLEIQTNTVKMDEHVNFVNNIYSQVKYPFHFLMNKINKYSLIKE